MQCDSTLGGGGGAGICLFQERPRGPGQGQALAGCSAGCAQGHRLLTCLLDVSSPHCRATQCPRKSCSSCVDLQLRSEEPGPGPRSR